MLALAAPCMAGETPSGDRAFRLRRVAVDAFGGGDATLSPDGRRFAISSRRTGNWEVWTYDIEAGTWKQWTDHPADDHEAQWSPDGRTLAFTSTRDSESKDVWTLSLADGTLKRVTNAPEDEEYPAWSPDGKTLVYTGGPWKRRDYFVVPATGGAPRAVTRRSGHVGACTFEPDGRAVICHTYESGSGDVILLPLDGEGRRLLTSGNAWDYKATVAPHQGWFAFSRSEDGPARIWLQRLDGAEGAEPLLREPTPFEDRWPTWDKSGTRLLFHRFVERGRALKVVDAAGGGVRELAAGENAGQASFDPEAKHVVYSAWDGPHQVLRVRALAGGAARLLDTGGGQAAFPRWSPDGRRIAFARKVDKRWEIATIDAAGGSLRVWTEDLVGVHGLAGPLDWSPDSNQLLFKADTAPFESDLFVLDTRDGRLRNLTNDEWFDEAPSWGPDARSVVFMSTRGGNWTWGLFRLPLGGQVEPLTPADYTEKNFPRLSATGVVTFSMYDEQGVERLAQRRADGTLHILATGGGHARWPSYSRDGRLVLVTEVEREVEYWLAENVFAGGQPQWRQTAAAPQARQDVASAQVRQAATAESRSTASLAGGARTGERSLVASPKNMHHR